MAIFFCNKVCYTEQFCCVMVACFTSMVFSYSNTEKDIHISSLN